MKYIVFNIHLQCLKLASKPALLLALALEEMLGSLLILVTSFWCLFLADLMLIEVAPVFLSSK